MCCGTCAKPSCVGIDPKLFAKRFFPDIDSCACYSKAELSKEDAALVTASLELAREKLALSTHPDPNIAFQNAFEAVNLFAR
jgi:hypothetical protein